MLYLYLSFRLGSHYARQHDDGDFAIVAAIRGFVELKKRTCTIGDKEIELQELTFDESIAVDSYVPVNEDGAPSPIALLKIYAIAAVRKINGEPLYPATGKVQYRRVAEKFTAADAFTLSKEYNLMFPQESEPGEALGAALKNGSSAQDTSKLSIS